MGLLLWPILWILFMLGLVVSTIVVSVRESSARSKAAKQLMANQPMPMSDVPGGEPAPSDGFGDAGQVEFAAFDENAFK